MPGSMQRALEKSYPVDRSLNEVIGKIEAVVGHCRQNAAVGMVTFVEYERGFGFVISSDPQSAMREIASQQPRRCRRKTNVTGIQALQSSLVRVIGQSQIIVREKFNMVFPSRTMDEALCIHGRQGAQISLLESCSSWEE